MQDKLKDLKNKISEIAGACAELIKRVKDLKELEILDNKYLGRKAGELTLILKNLSKLPLDEKKKIGMLANQLKKEITVKIIEKRKQLSNQSEEISLDVTLPINKEKIGHLHPISQIQYELEDIFTSMGFMVLDGPELESEYYNFDALNIPATHPARDMQDTFFVEGGADDNKLVMRTQTSPVQIRGMQKHGAPFRCVVPGRVFRCEALDDCHEHTFDQMEGLMIDKDISISNLISVMKELINKIFNKKIEVRLRPGYFPFVEPGFELDIRCAICGGQGCSSCKHSGWLELLPAGMVHPNVLKAGGIDSKKYSGFAFGLGLTRLAMMKYGVNDIRLFNSGDLRFLRQF